MFSHSTHSTLCFLSIIMFILLLLVVLKKNPCFADTITILLFMAVYCM